MVKAIWNNAVLAESDQCEMVEGNVYFPPGSIRPEYFRSSDHRTHCAWKGEASYYDIVVDDRTNRNAAWFYPQPGEAAAAIKDHVAFWHGVKVISD